ncbi:MAG: hypothetical protein IJM87_05200 [Ruminococcus sp.]|nr:hypothetical protein [Ruminococcus sp.]
MKLKRVIAGMAVSTIAASMFAVTASAYNFGIFFQTNGTWNYRNVYGGTDDGAVAFPDHSVGVQGGAGFDTNVDFGDLEITADGTYTLTMPCKGKMNDRIDEEIYGPEGDRVKDALVWTMAENYAPDADNPGQAVVSATTDKMNLLGITTDMPFEAEEQEDGTNKFYVDGKEVKITDVTVSFGGESYTLDEIYGDTEGETLNFNFINDWMKKKDKTALIEAGKLFDTANFAIPGADDTLSISFTITGLSEGGNTESSQSGTESSQASGDASSAAGTDASSKAADTSSAASKSGTTTTTTTTGTTATGTAAAGGSDATDSSAATGATAGLVFAGITLAGAAVVVSKRK